MAKNEKDTLRDETRLLVEFANLYHDHELYLPTRTIFLSSVNSTIDDDGGCDTKMAEHFIKNMDILETYSAEPITIKMNNIGGDSYHALAIYDAIKESPCKTTIVVRGHAMSAGSWILQAANERVMGPHATMLLHYGTDAMAGHSKTVAKQAAESERLNQLMESCYLSRVREKCPFFTLEQLQKILNHDSYMTAQQSIDLGLADRIG